MKARYRVFQTQAGFGIVFRRCWWSASERIPNATVFYFDIHDVAMAVDDHVRMNEIKWFVLQMTWEERKT